MGLAPSGPGAACAGNLVDMLRLGRALRDEMVAHARADHGMDEVPASLVDQVRAAIRPA